MQAWNTKLGRVSPPLKKGDLGGFQALMKIPPGPPVVKGGNKTWFSCVTLSIQSITSRQARAPLYRP
jgi:hypothetical protein